MKKSTRICCGLTLALAGSLCAAETELIDTNTPWQTYLVVGPTLRWQNGEENVWPAKGGGQLRVGRPVLENFPPFDPATADLDKLGFSPRPPADWMKPDAEVSPWSRYVTGELTDFLGVYGHRETWSQPSALCLRTRFGVADPAKATDLQVTVTCLGGAVVYVNGREIGRGFVPAGGIHLLTPATDLPLESYTLADGRTPLNLQLHAHTEKARFDQRIRTFTVSVPAAVLVKGGNVLAVEIHRAAVAGPQCDDRFESPSHLSVHRIRVTSATGAGVTSYEQATAGTWIWNANPEQQVCETPAATLRDDYRSHGRNRQVRGIAQGNPFDPVLPIRLAIPRNGVGSGQTVLTDRAGLRGVFATVSALEGPGGRLPAEAVKIRYAVQSPEMHYCDGLMASPPAGARTVPVWMIVQAPKDQAPGWYTGRLTVSANGKTFPVRVEALVTGATLPDARDFTSSLGIANAPDSVAGYYKVKPWSEEHFRLMEPSFRLMGQLGNDVLRVPVILGNMEAPLILSRGRTKPAEWQPLVRWVKKGGTLTPEFSLLEKYVDAYLKHCAPPKAISFYVWDARSARQTVASHIMVGMGSIQEHDAANLGKNALRVLQWDPVTDATTPLPAPEFEDEGAAAFWRPLLDGLRAVVTKRGWSDRVIVLGLGGDVRPSAKTGELLREWAPYARWHLLSHFSGDSAPKDGKMIATGKLEVGLVEQPYPCTRTAAVLAQSLTTTKEFTDLTTLRWSWVETSPPFTYRHLPLEGDLGQLGLDFWLKVKESPQNAGYFGGTDALTVPGPHGPEPTVRYQMLREGVQDMELRWAILRALAKLPADRRQAYEQLLDEHLRRAKWSLSILSQFELQYDWRAYAARVQQAAAELAGQPTQARWETPPAEGVITK